MLRRNKSEIWEDDAGNRKNFYRTVSEVPQNETDTDDENETKTLRTTMQTVTSTFTLEDWQNAVLEKEKEIRLVAEIGKNLLDKNCQLEQQLKQYVDAEIARNQQFEESQHKIKELKKERLLLEDQLRHAEFFNQKILRELKEKEEAVKIRTVEKKLNVFLSEQNKQLVEKLEQLKTELEAKNKAEASHKREISRLERQIKFMEESHNRTKELILEKSKEKIQKLTHNEELTKMKIQLDQLVEDLHRKEIQMEDLSQDKKKLEDKARSLAKRNEELKIENDFKSTELVRLQQTLEEEKLSAPYGANANAGHSPMKGSLFSELQQELAKSPPPKPTQPATPTKSTPTSPVQTPTIPSKATASAPATPSTPPKPTQPATPTAPIKATSSTPASSGKATQTSTPAPLKATTSAPPTPCTVPVKATSRTPATPAAQKAPLPTQNPAPPTNTTQEAIAEKDDRPDPKEEYFYLTASAMKINFAMKSKSEHVFQIREEDLFKLVLQEGIPFHEWHKWLKKKLLERVREFEIKESLKKNNRKSVGPVMMTRERRNSLV